MPYRLAKPHISYEGGKNILVDRISENCEISVIVDGEERNIGFVNEKILIFILFGVIKMAHKDIKERLMALPIPIENSISIMEEHISLDKSMNNEVINDCIGKLCSVNYDKALTRKNYLSLVYALISFINIYRGIRDSTEDIFFLTRTAGITKKMQAEFILDFFKSGKHLFMV